MNGKKKEPARMAQVYDLLQLPPRPSHLIAEDDKLLHKLLSAASFFSISPHSSVTPSLTFSSLLFIPFKYSVDTLTGYLFCEACAVLKWV